METREYWTAEETLRNTLRLRTLPVAVNFSCRSALLPGEDTTACAGHEKRITICQGVTMARLYGWRIGLIDEDLICVPAMIMFGFTSAPDQPATLARLFCEVGFAATPALAQKEAATMHRLPPHAYPAILLQPLSQAQSEPDVLLLYGNPAQIMRLAQAYAYVTGTRVTGNLGGKVECDEYLIAPLQTGAARIAVPGMGDRIFSMTQDDEMVFAMPGAMLKAMMDGLAAAGKNIGARYPVTFYQNFQPEFPNYYQTLGKELGLF